MALELGKMLVKAGKITEQQLQQALEAQKNGDEKLGAILVGLGAVTDENMTRFFITFNQAVRLVVDAVSTQGIDLLENIPIEAPEVIKTDR